MRVSRPFLVLVLFCLSGFDLSGFAIDQSEQAIAERILGPQWKQLSRRAGMIFAGTVLNTQSTTSQAVTSVLAMPKAPPALEITFRVDVPIAGVEPGQILKIHEWAAVWSMRRPMPCGQRILLFLYPPSRLGLTSPVGGAQGQIELDASGSYVAGAGMLPSRLVSGSSARAKTGSVSVAALERAIRSARQE